MYIIPTCNYYGYVAFQFLNYSGPSALAASRPNGDPDTVTGGLALCDDGDAPCVRATDLVDGDKVMDVTSNVIVGEPISVATGLWRVPYDVVDDAGNRAETAYRHVNH